MPMSRCSPGAACPASCTVIHATTVTHVERMLQTGSSVDARLNTKVKFRVGNHLCTFVSVC